MWNGDAFICDRCKQSGVWLNCSTQVDAAGDLGYVDVRIHQMLPLNARRDADLCDPCRLIVLMKAVDAVVARTNARAAKERAS